MTSVAMQATQGLTWDLTSYFPSFDGPELPAFKHKLEVDIAHLMETVSALPTLAADNLGEWAAALQLLEDINVRRYHLSSYLNNLCSAHADNEEYPQALAALSVLGASVTKVEVEFQRALKDCTDADFAAFQALPVNEGAEYFLTRGRFVARHSMNPSEERLNADLAVDGIHAWGRLYDKITGKLDFEMAWPDGRTERLPISRWRALMSDPDFNIGRSAFEAGNKTWVGLADVCAAALNGIAGWRLSLNKRRGYDHYLDVALFANGMSRPSLDAMYQAIYKNIDVMREYYRTKAWFAGRKQVWFFEREAQLPLKDSQLFSWQEGSDMVARAFHETYPALGAYYDEFLANGWMESEARGGKRPGAFCTGSPLTREQRVFMTYNGTLGDIGTLAHEIGHAWHSHLLRERRPVARSYPSTLAETASIFAEHVLKYGVSDASNMSESQKLLMLDESISGAALIILDITVRYEFEKAFHDERMKGEVSVSRLKELMQEKQGEVWGDCLEPGGEDPMFWASKLHFYISGATFYNFPYTVGWMLARTLANKLLLEGADFLPKYEAFMRLTGSNTVEDVVKKSLGEDTTDPAFWEGAIASLAPQVAELKEKLAALR